MNVRRVPRLEECPKPMELQPNRSNRSRSTLGPLGLHEKVLEAVFDSSTHGILGVDSRDKIRFANGMGERLFGYAPGELIDQSLSLLVPDRLRAVLETCTASYFRTPMTRPMGLDKEVVGLRKDGSEFPAEISLSYAEAPGESSLVLACVADITERRRIQRESDEFFEVSPDLLCITDKDGFFKRVNPTFERTLGWTAPELTSRPFLDFVHLDDREKTLAVYAHMLEGGTVLNFENRYICKDGSVRWLQWSARVPRTGHNVVAARDITEAKQLAEEQQRLVALIENSPDFIGMKTEADGRRILHINKAGRELLGFPPIEQLRTMTIIDLQMVAPSTLSAIDMALKKDGHWSGESVFYHYQTREPIPVDLRVSLVFDESSGATIGRAIVARDIRERKRAEEKLQESRIQTQAILSAIPDAVFRYKTDGTILDFRVPNPAWNLFLAPDEIVGANLRDMRAPAEIIEQIREATRKASDSRVLQTIEYSVNALLGAAQFEARIVPSGPEEMVAIVRDITQQKEAERALAEQRAFLRQVMDLDRNLIFAKDREGRFTLANRATAEAYGTSVDNLIGKTDTDFNPDLEEADRFRRDDLTVMDTLQEVIIEESLTAGTGRTRWLQTVKRPIIGPDGKADLVLGVSTDISESKQAEERMRALTGQLLTAQEEERRRIARELHDDITQKLAVVGIDLDLLRKHKDATKCGDQLAALHEQVLRLTEQIRNLSHEFHPGALEYAGLAATLESHCHEVARQAKIRVDFSTHGLPEAIPHDISVVLYRIAQEALRNTIKHSRATVANIILAGIQDPNGKTRLRLTAIDNGEGFLVEEVGNGAGLGLLSLEERARMVHGTLSVSSVPEEGTRVEVEVPLPEASV
jgi:PAS domain S-box-containing protein